MSAFETLQHVIACLKAGDLEQARSILKEWANHDQSHSD
jgi:cobalamin biosynthesis protein CobD/CbiB